MAAASTEFQVELPSQQEALLCRALQCLDGIARRDDCVLGGGTTLAARWHHRVSVDIDLFTSEAIYRRIKPALDHRVEQWNADGAFAEVRIHPSVVHCHLSDGLEFSIAGSDNVTIRPISNEREAVTGVPLQSTAEIIARKIRARMINRASYVVRDAYDLVCCSEFDACGFKEAMGALTKGEQAALKYDAGRASLTLDSTHRLIDPVHAEFNDAERLRKRLFEVLESYRREARRKLRGCRQRGPAP